MKMIVGPFTIALLKFLIIKLQGLLRRLGLDVTTTEQLYTIRSELRLCKVSKPAESVSQVREGEKRWQWSQLEIMFNSQSSDWRCSVKEDVLKMFLKFLQISQETLLLESLYSKDVFLKAWNLILKRLHHKCFLVKSAKLLRAPILKIICEQLLL